LDEENASWRSRLRDAEIYPVGALGNPRLAALIALNRPSARPEIAEWLSVADSDSALAFAREVIAETVLETLRRNACFLTSPRLVKAFASRFVDQHGLKTAASRSKKPGEGLLRQG
jgi:hypothetical protein